MGPLGQWRWASAGVRSGASGPCAGEGAEPARARGTGRAGTGLGREKSGSRAEEKRGRGLGRPGWAGGLPGWGLGWV